MRAPSEQTVRRHLRLGPAGELTGALTRSYLPDGRCVGWCDAVRGAGSLVLDAELDDRPPPAALARLYGAEDFWVRWTRVECAAKMADVPIAVWLRQWGLAVQTDLALGLVTLRPDWLDPALVVTVGVPKP